MSAGVSTVNVVLDSARGHLNDDEQLVWQDPKIFPKFQEAYREMVNIFDLNDIPIIYAVSKILTVPANTSDDSNLDLSTVTDYPTDLLEPIWLKERLPGQRDTDFVDMQQVDFIPQCEIDESQLVFWCWINNAGTGFTIMLRGCLQPTEVMIRYKRYLAPPTELSASVIVPGSEVYLSYRTAALCAASTGSSRFDYLSATANINLDMVVCSQIKALQNLPAKRRPYHRGRGRNRVLRDF